ncbi:MAG TPA: class E sortase [Candidatus Aquicultor sp.]|jgi:sortase A
MYRKRSIIALIIAAVAFVSALSVLMIKTAPLDRNAEARGKTIVQSAQLKTPEKYVPPRSGSSQSAQRLKDTAARQQETAAGGEAIRQARAAERAGDIKPAKTAEQTGAVKPASTAVTQANTTKPASAPKQAAVAQPADPPPAPAPVTIPTTAQERPKYGSAIAKIVIPKIGVNETVYEGAGQDVLALGPGHLEETALPGDVGNAVIGGHRVTHTRPFYYIDALKVGDPIYITRGSHQYVYKVVGQKVVLPTEMSITNPTPDRTLTIFACHPLYSAAQRYVVIAKGS